MARHQHDPLVAALLRGGPARTAAGASRGTVRELAALLCGAWMPGAGALPLGDGHGIAWVDNARGLLVHRVAIDPGSRVRDWRIVAPTEWNFHPAGALVAELVGAVVADAQHARRLAQRAVQALDPCVACEVELADA